MIVEEPPRYLDSNSSAPKPDRIDYPVSRRLERMRALTRLLDTAFQLPGGFRFGIDPLIGLVPGVGDIIASGLSIWLIYDAARLGIKKRILLLMIVNVVIEAAVGAFPVLGDILDAVWKANVRNMRLVEKHYRPTVKERSLWKLMAFLFGTVIIVYGSIAFALFVFLSWLLALFGPIFKM
jgi:hypothetical protein